MITRLQRVLEKEAHKQDDTRSAPLECLAGKREVGVRDKQDRPRKNES